jgi:hypothetical protein
VHGTASSTGIGQSIAYAECGCDAGNWEAFVFVCESIERLNVCVGCFGNFEIVGTEIRREVILNKVIQKWNKTSQSKNQIPGF